MLENFEQVVVVAGCQRSGTTLVGQILGSHPLAYLVDEPDGLYEWFEALSEMRADSDHLLKNMLRSARTKYQQSIFRENRNATDKRPPWRQASHLVLKAPNLTYSYDALKCFERPVRIIYPVRDARAVVASMGRLGHHDFVARQIEWIGKTPQVAKELAEELTMLSDPDVPSHIKRAMIWRIKTTMYQRFVERDIPTFVFRYEELVADPDTMSARVAKEAGLPASLAPLSPSAVYRGMGPGLTVRSRPVDRASLESWSHRLQPQEIADILSIAGPVMKDLGYDLAAPTRPIAAVHDIAEETLRSPIILVGRGGSGTRLISDLAQLSGIFIGNRLNQSGDSLEWADLIYELALDSIAPLLGQPAANPAQWEPLLLARARDILASGRWREGMKWGWKLPETMLALPRLTQVFESAKVVHLVRHPVDVSLRRSHKTSRADDPVGGRALRAAYRRAGLRTQTIQLDDEYLRNAISWQHQVEAVVEFGRSQLGSGRYIEVRYEDLCSDPAKAWAPVAEFLGVSLQSSADHLIDTGRMNHYAPDDPRAIRVWNSLQGPCTQARLPTSHRHAPPKLRNMEFGNCDALRLSWPSRVRPRSRLNFWR